MAGFLFYSIPKLFRVKKLDPKMTVNERDRYLHQVPKSWARTFMKLTGSSVHIEGESYIPDGPVVFVCNHEGNFDIPVLLGYINKPFGFVSKIEVKKVPIMSSWMEVMNCTFLDRKNRDQAFNSLRKGVEILKQGHSTVIFPEGTRSKGGPIGLFKQGGFRLAKDAGVPIVPISIKGTSNIFEKNGRLIKPAEIHVKIGKPIIKHIQNDIELRELAEYTKQIIIDNLDQMKKAS
ncbi:1-acyl-sn-glycerol-3-phosphate acyltransferase [Bacillus sp. UNCCL13]|nr:lysophospholipid acyltransferase family protein [Bacillus sp. UNCCL13]